MHQQEMNRKSNYTQQEDYKETQSMLIEIRNDSNEKRANGKSLAEAFKNRVGNHRNSIENFTSLASPDHAPLMRHSEVPR